MLKGWKSRRNILEKSAWKITPLQLFVSLLLKKKKYIYIYTYIYIFIFIYLLLAALGLHCSDGLSLFAACGGYSLIPAQGLLLTAASLAAERRLKRAQALVAAALRPR